MTQILSNVLAEVTREAYANLPFRQRLLEALRADALAIEASGLPDRSSRAAPRARNRREKAALDPYQEILQGEESLRMRLSSLTVEQLKDVVSEHALDSSRLALKWKSPARLIDLIVATVRGRLEKGDAFRVKV